MARPTFFSLLPLDVLNVVELYLAMDAEPKLNAEKYRKRTTGERMVLNITDQVSRTHMDVRLALLLGRLLVS